MRGAMIGEKEPPFAMSSRAASAKSLPPDAAISRQVDRPYAESTGVIMVRRVPSKNLPCNSKTKSS